MYLKNRIIFFQKNMIFFDRNCLKIRKNVKLMIEFRRGLKEGNND